MRADSLANDKVIELLNGYTVPLYYSNSEFSGRGTLSKEDLEIWQRDIYGATQAAGFDAGNVCVSILSPDGKPADGIIVAQACGAGVLIPRLEAAIKKYNVKKGEPLVKPSPQSIPPKVKEGSKVLHMVARSVEGAWMPTPSENWIVLDAEKAKKLLPSDPVKVGTSWDVDKDVSIRIMSYFFPNSENCTARTDRFKRQSLKATVVSVEGGVARARLEGEFAFLHMFYPGNPGSDGTSEGKVVGYADFDLAKRDLKTFKLVAASAKYGDIRFTVAVRSAP